MKSFQGSTLAKLDMSCRLKLPPNVVADFKSVDPTGNVILRFLPEGAVAILPASFVEQKDSTKPKSQDYFGNDRLRMQLRSMTQFTEEATISPQGRITIPEKLRKYLGVEKEEEVALIGMLCGYEIWKQETLQAEMDKELEQARRQYEQAREMPSE